MTSENMMAELRRIVGALMEEYEAEKTRGAKAYTGRFESDRSARAAAILGANSCGRACGIGIALVELSRTFGISLSEFAAVEGAARDAHGVRAE